MATPSRRLQIREAIVAALDGPELPAGARVKAARTLPFSAKQLPAIAVYLGQEVVDAGPGPGPAPLARRRLLVRVQVQVALAPDEEDLDRALDPLTAYAVRAILADPRLGGLAINTTERQTEFATEESQPVFGGALLSFVVDYVTAAADPALKS